MATRILTDAEFELFRDLVYRSCGILFTEKNRLRLDHKVTERAEQVGHDTATDYYQQLVRTRSPETEREIKTLLDILTINETYFFRNPAQIEIFMRHVVPELADRKLTPSGDVAGGGPAGFVTLPSFRVKPRISVWSAGCSTGQEPYTLAIALVEALGLKAARLELKVHATDISETSLVAAREAVFEKKRLESMNPVYVAKYFQDLGDGRIRVKEEIRKLASFQYANLKDRAPFGGLDAIFCRNVMIYFDAPMQRHIVEEFHRALAPGGILFIGHSETLQNHPDLFQFVKLGDGLAYRRRDAGNLPAGKSA